MLDDCEEKPALPPPNGEAAPLLNGVPAAEEGYGVATRCPMCCWRPSRPSEDVGVPPPCDTMARSRTRKWARGLLRL